MFVASENKSSEKLREVEGTYLPNVSKSIVLIFLSFSYENFLRYLSGGLLRWISEGGILWTFTLSNITLIVKYCPVDTSHVLGDSRLFQCSFVLDRILFVFKDILNLFCRQFFPLISLKGENRRDAHVDPAAHLGGCSHYLSGVSSKRAFVLTRSCVCTAFGDALKTWDVLHRTGAW